MKVQTVNHFTRILLFSIILSLIFSPVSAYADDVTLKKTPKTIYDCILIEDLENEIATNSFNAKSKYLSNTIALISTVDSVSVNGKTINFSVPGSNIKYCAKSNAIGSVNSEVKNISKGNTVLVIGKVTQFSDSVFTMNIDQLKKLSSSCDAYRGSKALENGNIYLSDLYCKCPSLLGINYEFLADVKSTNIEKFQSNNGIRYSLDGNESLSLYVFDYDQVKTLSNYNTSIVSTKASEHLWVEKYISRSLINETCKLTNSSEKIGDISFDYFYEKSVNNDYTIEVYFMYPANSGNVVAVFYEYNGTPKNVEDAVYLLDSLKTA